MICVTFSSNITFMTTKDPLAILIAIHVTFITLYIYSKYMFSDIYYIPFILTVIMNFHLWHFIVERFKYVPLFQQYKMLPIGLSAILVLAPFVKYYFWNF